MDAKQRAFVENKLKGMDEQYFTSVSMHLSHISITKDALFKEQKEAFSGYFVTCFEIAEAKYVGYWKLIEDAATVEDEIRIQTEFKEKIHTLEQKCRQYVEQIENVHKKLLSFTIEPFPLDNYNAVYFSEGKMYPCEDSGLRSVS